MAMRDDAYGPEVPDPDARAELLPLGPPGWEEFQAARRRFETSLEQLGVEQAASRVMRGRRVLAEQGVARRWG